MSKFSIVIIARDASDVIEKTLESFRGATDDIIVYDSGGDEATRRISEKFSARYYHGDWSGFGPTKNKANQLAKYDWILSLDADEALDGELRTELAQLHLSDHNLVYELKFKNLFEGKWMRYGEWGKDSHIRMFHRNHVKWNDSGVHERLIIPPGFQVVSLKGHILHDTAPDANRFREKMLNYARLNASNYDRGGKKIGKLRPYLSCGFSFVKNYLFKLGFLDGGKGFQCAIISAQYSYEKYRRLRAIQAGGKSDRGESS